MRAWALAIGFAAACSQTTSTVESGPLPEGVAARVAEDDIASDMVARVARAQGLSKKEARDRLVGDALFAAEARARLRGTGYVESAERAGLARAILEVVREEARAQGAPSDAEVDAIVTERWYELDRPRLARTTHAVVMTKTDADLAKARRVADAIVEAVRGVSDKAEFTKRARAVPAQDLQVRVEDLDPVAEDGRVMPSRPPVPGAPPMTFDLAFARGALALEKAGDQSPIVQSSFGLHVILLTETLEPIHYSRQQLNELVRQEVLDRRAKKLEDALLERLARSTAVSRERSASDLMMRVKVREP